MKIICGKAVPSLHTGFRYLFVRCHVQLMRGDVFLVTNEKLNFCLVHYRCEKEFTHIIERLIRKKIRLHN